MSVLAWNYTSYKFLPGTLHGLVHGQTCLHSLLSKKRWQFSDCSEFSIATLLVRHVGGCNVRCRAVVVHHRRWPKAWAWHHYWVHSAAATGHSLSCYHRRGCFPRMPRSGLAMAPRHLWRTCSGRSDIVQDLQHPSGLHCFSDMNFFFRVVAYPVHSFCQFYVAAMWFPQERKIGYLANNRNPHQFVKHPLSNIPSGTIDWLREHRVSLLLFRTWGQPPTAKTGSGATPTSTPAAPIPSAPASVVPHPATAAATRPSSCSAPSDAAPAATVAATSASAAPDAAPAPTGGDSNWMPLLVTQLPPPLMERKALLQLLRNRPEWCKHRVDIKYRPRVFGESFYDVECVDSIDCAKKWRAFYIVGRTNMHPPRHFDLANSWRTFAYWSFKRFRQTFYTMAIFPCNGICSWLWARRSGSSTCFHWRQRASSRFANQHSAFQLAQTVSKSKRLPWHSTVP